MELTERALLTCDSLTRATTFDAQLVELAVGAATPSLLTDFGWPMAKPRASNLGSVLSLIAHRRRVIQLTNQSTALCYVPMTTELALLSLA
jgi:hypothetical protein